MSFHDEVESGFVRWGHWLIGRPKLVIGLCLSFAALLAIPGLWLSTDHSIQSLLHPEDPSRIVYDDFLQRFGGGEDVIIAIETSNVFDLIFLEKLRALHHELEESIPHLDEIQSLVNARITRGVEDQLIVEDLEVNWPEHPQGLEALEEKIRSHPLYVGALISEDARLAVLRLKPSEIGSTFEEADAALDEVEWTELTGDESSDFGLSGAQRALFAERIREVAEPYQADQFKLHFTGLLSMEERLNAQVTRDVATFTWVAGALVVCLLFFLFRRLSGILLPALIVILALVSTMGLMGLLSVPFSMTTGILPPFLLTVGVCGALHLLVLFYGQLQQGISRSDAIVHSLRHSGMAIAMTGLTTAGGLISFYEAPIAPISQLGIVAPLGVLLATAYTLVLLPAVLAVLPLGPVQRGQSGVHRISTWFLELCEKGSIGFATWVIVGWCFAILGSLVGISRLHFSQDYLSWFPEDEPVIEATNLIDEKMNGAMTVEVMIDAGEVDGLYNTALLRQIDEAEEAVRLIERNDLSVGHAFSLTDISKEVHQALNANRSEFFKIPDSSQLLAQEFLLFEGSGSSALRERVDSEFRRTRVTLKVPWADAIDYPDFLDQLDSTYGSVLPAETRFGVTGVMALFGRVSSSLLTTMTRSYLIALAVITPLMILFLGSFRRGVFSMIPNLAPILLTLGVMGWLGIPLDITSLMVGGIIIGLAVDDTIHFMHRFNRVYARTGDPRTAIRETLQATGRAMLFTSVVLASGFFVFGLAHMENISTFGLLAGMATLLAFLADVTLAPAMMLRLTETGDRQAGS